MARLVTGPRLIGAAIIVVLAAAVVLALRKPPIEVEVAVVKHGPLTVTVDDLAETRVRNLYVVAAPITGELTRVLLKPGARVTAGVTLLARIQPAKPGAIDARATAQIEADVRSLQAQALAAHGQTDQAQADLDLAERQFARTSALRADGFASQASFDQSRAVLEDARARLRSSSSAEQAARASVDAARAALITRGSGLPTRGVENVYSPVSGFLLTVPQESERVVAAGTPLATVGDPAQLELVTDLLTNDALLVQPGAPVSIEDWGGDHALKGRVRLIEPFGFLKISALGVEEQRVNVVIDFAEPRRDWQRLGHGFRATVRITIWSAPSVLRVPVSALFRGAGWEVFRITAGGRVETVPVQIGRMNADFAQVRHGLSANDRVVVHPGETVVSGARVTIRNTLTDSP